MLTELIVLLISYLGVFVGFGLSKIAKEEVVPGKKNLVIFSRVLFLIILFAAFYNSPLSLLYQRLIIIMTIAVLYYFKSYYGVLGILFSVNPNFIVSSLIFLYGFPEGSLMHKENISSITKKTIGFLIFGLIGLLLRNYVL